MLTQEQDQQLVERVQRGDKRAFDLLVLKYQHKILGLIVRFVHDAQEAQDVAQEASSRHTVRSAISAAIVLFIPGCIGSPSTPRRTTWSLAGVGHRTAM